MSIHINKPANQHKEERAIKLLREILRKLANANQSHGEVYVHYGIPEVTEKLATASEMGELLLVGSLDGKRVW